MFCSLFESVRKKLLNRTKLLGNLPTRYYGNNVPIVDHLGRYEKQLLRASRSRAAQPVNQ